MGKTGRKNNSYSAKFKLKAVEQYLSGEIGGLTIATRKLGLRSKTQLGRWIKLYRHNPELLKQDNREKASLKDGVCKRKPKQVKLDELSKDEQIEYLKMENAVLKKAKALRKDYGER